MTIPYADNTAGGILAIHDNYYEFIPADEALPADGGVLQCHELEEGRQYRIILTNGRGLYRYDIQDVIEVCGFYNRTPVIAFVRKGDDMLNITGEKLHENHVVEAFRMLDAAHGLSVTRFRAVPNHRDLRYEVLVQFGSEVPHGFLRDTLLPQLDKCWSAANIEYDAKRRSRRLNPPCIHVMDASWADDARKRSLEARHRDVQYKWRVVAREMSGGDAGHVQATITM